MKIMQLRAENVKRLGIVEITPEGNVIIIGGKNGAGKSSVIDSIWYAMGGKGAAPSDPIRHGEKMAEVSITIGNGEEKLHVTRTWTREGSHLKVKNEKGTPLKAPQSILDALYGSLTFDPLAFAGMKGADQIDTLKQLTGLDLVGIEGEREAAYTTRTEVGRDLRQAEANFKAATFHRDVPEEQMSITELLEQRRNAQLVLDRINSLNQRIQTKNQEIASLTESIQDLRAQVAAMSKERDGFDPPDIHQFDEQIANTEAIAQKQRDNDQALELQKRYEALETQHQGLNHTIEELDERKRLMVSSAKMPVEGLTFGSEAVLYQGVPLDQASSAERLRVSVAIGIAMNAKLKVLLIRDGSLLDKNNLAMIARMAEEADAQLWIERVGDGDECSVVIEDGHVSQGAAL